MRIILASVLVVILVAGLVHIGFASGFLTIAESDNETNNENF